MSPFSPLRNRVFLRLYLAEAISLFGDAFTWLGLALVSFQFGPDRSAAILASALTLRVTAYIVFAPFAGALADRIHRKTILWVTHLFRTGIVAALPFITQEWHMYSLVFALNVFSAFFTPAYRATIPSVVTEAEYRPAVGLSTATFQLLGVLGPGVAGVFAGWLGVREIFFVDALSFVLAGLIILTLPSDLGESLASDAKDHLGFGRSALEGLRQLISHPYLRFALAVEFLAAIAGAQILVNTVGHIKSVMGLDDHHYGWAMSAFALGAALAAFASGNLDKSPSRRRSLITGALLLGGTVAMAGSASYPVFIILWLLAGLGQSLAEIPSETLIGENVPSDHQGQVYGAHFAVSHLWWAIAYPIAGMTGQNAPKATFLYAGVSVCVISALLAALTARPRKDKFLRRHK